MKPAAASPPNPPRVHCLHDADSGTCSYVVADAQAGAALIVDPVLDFDASSGRTGTQSGQRLLDLVAACNYRVEWILETHAHADHLSAAPWLKAQLGARTGIGAGIVSVQKVFKDVFNLEPGFATDGSQFDHLFTDGECFSLGSIACAVIATPGHTSDSVTYRIGDALFVGDSLFLPDGGTARCDFPGGDAATLFASIQKLYCLPDATRVFVCHDYCPGGRASRCQSTIGAEKSDNIHVNARVPQAEFIALRRARDATLPMPRLIIPAVQVNIRAGELPPAEANGVRYLKVPLDRL